MAGQVVPDREQAERWQPLPRLVAALFADLDADGQRDFIALVRAMRVDRVRVLDRAVWTAEQLTAHHRTTFTLSVDLMLATAGCSARASAVPSLIDAFAWCSVFRDLDDYWQPYLAGGSSVAQRYAASLGNVQREALRERLQSILPMADDGSIRLLARAWAVRGTK